MQWSRFLRHSALPHWWSQRQFPPAAQQAITAAIAASETRHRGELRFVVEGGLPVADLWHGRSPRQRALELFAQLGVWDTQDNSGVLIYVQLVDRRVEIVADRGIDARLGESFWQSVCRDMETAFAHGDFLRGALAAIETIGGELARHYPPLGDNPNELPDEPLLL